MSRMLRRALFALLTTALLAPATPSTARSPRLQGASEGTAAARAVAYIAGTQSADGGFFGPNQPVATSGGLADTLIAVAADEGLSEEARDVALQRLASLAPSATTRPAYTGRIVMAIVAVGSDPTRFGDVDYAARLTAARAPGGWWETQNYANALAMLGWGALRRTLPTESVAWVQANQCPDGGWGFQTACLSASDIDTTALTLNALIAGGVPRDHGAVSRGRLFLLSAQNDAGGFGDRPNAETNANSTGLVLSAIAALDESPRDEPWNHGGGRDPRTQLSALQTPDGGFLWKAAQSSLIDNYATVQATPGVAGLAYPVFARADAGCRDLPGRRAGRCPAPRAPARRPLPMG